MPVTIKDVAKAAGVSPSTVSRVIADSPKISDTTKKKVYAIMEEMRYEPNIIARSLANKVTYTLGLILPAKEEGVFENPFFMQAMRGLSLYAQQKGYYIMYSYCKTEEEELESLGKFINSKWVDGIILTATRIEDKNIAFLKNQTTPFVIIGRPEEDRDQMLWVDNDNVAAMEEVVLDMIETGHKKIAFVGGEQQYTVNRHRLRGYKRALEEKGIVFDPNLVIEDDPTEDKAYEGMKSMLEKVQPDAIVGTDDLVAYGAFKAAMQLGQKAVAVAGFNNTPLAVLKSPGMSSVDIRAQELGQMAAKLLISRIENKPMPANHIILDAHYIQRASTLDFKTTDR